MTSVGSKYHLVAPVGTLTLAKCKTTETTVRKDEERKNVSGFHLENLSCSGSCLTVVPLVHMLLISFIVPLSEQSSFSKQFQDHLEWHHDETRLIKHFKIGRHSSTFFVIYMKDNLLNDSIVMCLAPAAVSQLPAAAVDLQSSVGLSATSSASPGAKCSSRPQVEKPRRSSLDKEMKHSPDRAGKSPPPPPPRRSVDH